MKLKKVISLVLGGVLALSMLAGCSVSKNDDGTSDVTIDNTTVTVDTEIVDYVEQLIDSGVVKFVNYEDYEDMMPLSGSESDHTEFAIAYLNKNWEGIGESIEVVDAADIEFEAEKKTTSLILVDGGSVDNYKQIGNYIIDALEAIDVDGNSECPVDSITVLVLDTSELNTLAGSNVGWSVDDKMYVIVYTGAKALSGYTQN